MEKCNVALYGCGTVGRGVAEILLENQAGITRSVGRDIRLACVVDKRVDELQKLPLLAGIPLCSDLEAPINDPEIDIIIELIGGVETAGEITEKALKAGKNVVTANKALLANRADALFKLARQHGRSIGFEASVAGGVPIISTLRDSFVAESISSIFGIVNGTCNYILTRMTEEGVSYPEGLAEAREKGYAEADATLDVEGHDSAHKLAILARLAFGINVSDNDIYCEGISHINPADISYAGSLGYKLKLLAIGRKKDDGVELRVHPTLLHRSHPLAVVDNSINAVCVHGQAVGEVTLTGLGAGAEPTAGAVIADVCSMALGVYQEDFRLLPVFGGAEKIDCIPQEQIETKYYFRLSCMDRAGVLARVAGVLGEHDISIDSCIQQGRAHQDHGYVPVVFMTHRVKEENLLNALREINSLECIDGAESAMLRVAEI